MLGYKKVKKVPRVLNLNKLLGIDTGNGIAYFLVSEKYVGNTTKILEQARKLGQYIEEVIVDFSDFAGTSLDILNTKYTKQIFRTNAIINKRESSLVSPHYTSTIASINVEADGVFDYTSSFITDSPVLAFKITLEQ